MKKHGNKDRVSYKRRDLTGQKFAKITIIEFHEKRGKHIYWKAVCDCGEKFSISTTTFGKTQSCGCINKLEKGRSSFNKLMNSYKFRAMYSGLDFQLNEEQFELLTKGNCAYCNIEPSQISSGEKLNGEYIFNGIDRVDSDLGYTPANSVSCCDKCNYAKRDMTFNQFKEWIERVYKNLKGEV